MVLNVFFPYTYVHTNNVSYTLNTYTVSHTYIHCINTLFSIILYECTYIHTMYALVCIHSVLQCILCIFLHSAQLMLTMSSLKDLVTADKSVLKQLCAIIPTKCLEMFASITHTSVVDRAAPGSTKVSHTHNLPLYNRLRHQPGLYTCLV